MLKLVSVTKGSRILVDGEEVDRRRVVDLSHNWSERDVTLFKKIVKQGGSVKIKGKSYNCTPAEKVTTSKGWADGGAAPMPGPEN